MSLAAVQRGEFPRARIDESGRTEVWVRPFRAPGPATQVSIDGGFEAAWSPNGRELFFRRGASFFAVELEGGDGLRPGSPREMFSGRYDLSPTGHQHFDVDPGLSERGRPAGHPVPRDVLP